MKKTGSKEEMKPGTGKRRGSGSEVLLFKRKGSNSGGSSPLHNNHNPNPNHNNHPHDLDPNKSLGRSSSLGTLGGELLYNKDKKVVKTPSQDGGEALTKAPAHIQTYATPRQSETQEEDFLDFFFETTDTSQMTRIEKSDSCIFDVLDIQQQTGFARKTGCTGLIDMSTRVYTNSAPTLSKTEKVGEDAPPSLTEGTHKRSGSSPFRKKKTSKHKKNTSKAGVKGSRKKRKKTNSVGGPPLDTSTTPEGTKKKKKRSKGSTSKIVFSEGNGEKDGDSGVTGHSKSASVSHAGDAQMNGKKSEMGRSADGALSKTESKKLSPRMKSKSCGDMPASRHDVLRSDSAEEKITYSEEFDVCYGSAFWRKNLSKKNRYVDPKLIMKITPNRRTQLRSGEEIVMTAIVDNETDHKVTHLETTLYKTAKTFSDKNKEKVLTSNDVPMHNIKLRPDDFPLKGRKW
eukprot:CAMPEP_0174258632 /NCGR_PEP_ID=MMETSP0439-20130205/7590_1 /TAXON_ID=0 /ORGANISM="Stereomyxa ramosa, Strain Chinc5" /LENGTH=456 /DNA_ID=CAMNT_0015342207 /DNA_START=266 /DNA_END=1633 /DNA_ORIENTATION=+